MRKASNNETQRGEYSCPSLGQDIHDKIREAEVDVGGEETTTKKLMRPQSEEVEG